MPTAPSNPLETDNRVRTKSGELQFARKLRTAFGLDAAVDYPTAAMELLGRADRCDTLLVVGGGMLARAVAQHSRESGYRRVVMVTRSPKRARRRLASSADSFAICVPERARALLGTARWVTVIATTNIVEPYREQISVLIDDPACLGAVDLSSVPIRPDITDRYEHMYGPRFTALVAAQNRVLADRAQQVRRVIAEIYGED